MILEIGIIVGGCIAYMLLDDRTPEDKSQTPNKKVIEYNHAKATEQYWNTLTLEEQEYYFDNNLDLRDYKEQFFTDYPYFNTKHVADLAKKLNKPFTNKYKTY